VIHVQSERHTPQKEAAFSGDAFAGGCSVEVVVPVSVTHPPIFSGLPDRKRIFSLSKYPPSLASVVDSLDIPGLSCSFWRGMV